MKKILIFAIIALVATSCKHGTQLNKIVRDKNVKQKILLNECNRDAFEKKRFYKWFNQEYMTYIPNDTAMTRLARLDYKDVSATVVFGTWCSDSRREVPRFYKIIDQLNIAPKSIKLIAVNGRKESDALGKITVERVPVFIFYKKGIEIGRIIERPKTSLEEDIYLILK